MTSNGYMILSGSETGKKKKKVPLRIGMIYEVNDKNKVESRPYYYSLDKSSTPKHINVRIIGDVIVRKIQIPDNCEYFALTAGYDIGAIRFDERCVTVKPIIVPKSIKKLQVHNTAQIANMEHFIDNEDTEILFRATNTL